MFDKIIVQNVFGGFWEMREKARKIDNKYIRGAMKVVLGSYMQKRGFFVGSNAKFKGVPQLPHGLHGIFITEKAEIGKNCVIFHQVTIGSNTLPDSKGMGYPKIGDNCYISAGAKIVGDVTIGDNVRIGANCVVFKDVPDNSVVVLPSPRVITRETKLNNKHYSVKKDGTVHYRYDGKKIKETNEEIIKSFQESF